MSFAGDPAGELIRIFREEAGEHLDGIVDCLLEVEAGKASADTTDELFRYTHSIKGNAGMVGLKEAAEIANAIEDVLERARHDGALPDAVTEPLLRATDALRRAVDGELGIATAAIAALALTAPTGEPSRPTSDAEHPTEISEDPLRRVQALTNGHAPRDAGAVRTQASGTRSIRVPAHKVDRMLDAVSETILHHRRLEHVLDGSQSGSDEALDQEVDRGELLLDELQDAVLDMRTVPLSSITGALPRAVRDLASAQAKQARLEITGADTQLDRVLLDGMSDAIVHLLRNAVAHGIESPGERERAGKPACGTIQLHAEPRGELIAIEVRDDGRGVDAHALTQAASRGSLVEVLTEPGFSTAAGVSDIAGRGVGLDAVKRQVEAVGGSLAIDTEPSGGTCATLLLPVTLALLRVLIIERAGQRFGVPLTGVSEVLAAEQIMTLGGRQSIHVHGESLKLADLALALGMQAADLPPVPQALIVNAAGGRLAIACDRVLDEDEVVVKPLGAVLAGLRGYLGATILDDGTVMLILDAAELLRRGADVGAVSSSVTAARPQDRAPKVLVVDDQFTVRELQRAILRAAGYSVEVAADGREALATLTAKRDFDIVVTDLQMPEMDGLELLAAIRSDPNRSWLPVIIVTSRGSEEDRRRGVQAGADAYIVKDEFDQQALLDTVGRLVGSQ